MEERRREVCEGWWVWGLCCGGSLSLSLSLVMVMVIVIVMVMGRGGCSIGGDEKGCCGEVFLWRV